MAHAEEWTRPGMVISYKFNISNNEKQRLPIKRHCLNATVDPRPKEWLDMPEFARWKVLDDFIQLMFEVEMDNEMGSGEVEYIFRP